MSHNDILTRPEAYSSQFSLDYTSDDTTRESPRVKACTSHELIGDGDKYGLFFFKHTI